MSKKKTKGRLPKQQQETQAPSTLSMLLHQADSCLVIDTAFPPVEKDKVLVEGGHFLTRKTRNRIVTARLVLQGLENSIYSSLDDVQVPTKISYKELKPDILDQFSSKRIPVREDKPFSFNYEMLGEYLPQRVQCAPFFHAFIELMLNEWKINFARKLFVGFGFEDWSHHQATPEQVNLVKDLARIREPALLQTGAKLKTTRGLWFLSECLIRVRAQWDKLIDHLVFRRFFPKEPPKRFTSTIQMLQKDFRNYEFIETDLQRECLDALIALATQTEKLRGWRDNDLHNFSETVFGVLDKANTEQSLNTLWEMVIEEHNRVREAIIAFIGCVVLRSPTSTMWCEGVWKQPTRYINHEDNNDVVLNQSLINTVQRWRDLNEKDLPISPDEKEALGKEIHSLVARLFGCDGNSQK